MSGHSAQRKHATVTVRVGSWMEDIDEEIAPLIREIWLAGVQTTMSCQEDGWGTVWIMFPGEADLVAFLNMVAEYEPGGDTLYNRINPRWEDSRPGLSWEFEIFPHGLALVGDGSAQERHDGVPDVILFHSVRFPRGDLPVVFERVKRHNRQSLEPAPCV